MSERKLVTLNGYRLESQDEEKFYETAKWILTSQEHILLGSTPDPDLLREYKHLFLPIGYLTGRMSIEEIIKERSIREYSCVLTAILKKPELLALSLPLLHPQTYETTEDPIVLGKYDEESDQLELIRGSFLTRVYFHGYQNRTFRIQGKEYPILRPV